MLRHALLTRLLRAASLPAAVALGGACLSAETRCFEHAADRCPVPGEAAPHIPLECDERLESVDSDADRVGATCCYEVTVETLDSCLIEGRPLVVERAAITAGPRERPEWAAAQAPPAVGDLDDERRARLAQLWTRAALFEHASVASFSRFALQLMAVGAPPSLLEEAHRAAMDEVQHAAAAFALASAYRGAPVGPSRLPLPSHLPLRASLQDLAVTTAVEACVNETLAVLVAIEKLARATDPAVRRVLERIVDDESRHAALAWCTVRWAVESGGPQVKAAVARALQAARPDHTEVHPDVCVEARDEILEGHGLLDRGAHREAIRRGYEEVVMPCAATLLDTTPAATSVTA